MKLKNHKDKLPQGIYDRMKELYLTPNDVKPYEKKYGKSQILRILQTEFPMINPNRLSYNRVTRESEKVNDKTNKTWNDLWNDILRKGDELQDKVTKKENEIINKLPKKEKKVQTKKKKKTIRKEKKEKKENLQVVNGSVTAKYEEDELVTMIANRNVKTLERKTRMRNALLEAFDKEIENMITEMKKKGEDFIMDPHKRNAYIKMLALLDTSIRVDESSADTQIIDNIVISI